MSQVMINQKVSLSSKHSCSLIKWGEEMKRVFIIGNGFDLAHGLKTSYFDFSDYLRENDKLFYDQIMEYNLFKDNDLWSDFENNLSKINIDSLTAYANLQCNDDMDYDSMEGDNVDFSVYGELDYIDRLSEKIKDWLSDTVDVSKCKKIINPVYLKDSLWLTFNYTNTLEDLYGVNSECILHIHEDVDNYNNDLLIGHGNDQAINELENECQQLYYGREYSAKKAIVRYLRKSRKPVKSRIEDNQTYFSDYADADEIYILGFSFGNVDMPYIDKVASSSPNADIYISFYDIGTIPGILCKMKGYEPKIRFLKIEDLKTNPPTCILKS